MTTTKDRTETFNLDVGRTAEGARLVLTLELTHKGPEYCTDGAIIEHGTTDGRKVTEYAELSICGSYAGDGGQCTDAAREVLTKGKPAIPAADLARIVEIWDRWHLNGMSAACEHQRAAGWQDVRIPPAELPESHANRDERGILAIWVYPKEHAAGLLTKPCPTCGYKYGAAWLVDALPADVEAEARRLFSAGAGKPDQSELDAAEFFKASGLTFSAVHGLREKCPNWCDGKHTHGDHYRVTVKRKGGRSFAFDFWNSQADAEAGKRPDAYSTLGCLTLADPGTLAGFCSEYGYDADSRKGAQTWRACLAQWRKVSAFFTAEEIETLQAWR